ncbi:MAG TPA: hypothetical protein VMI11_11375 [Actinomycetes bacterium]|nr:hypothetical protein [Actinomycetes bacterium]
MCQAEIEATLPLYGAGTCRSYRQGHNVHWITWTRYRDAPRRAAEILAVEATAVALYVDGGLVVWRHHHPECLRAAAAPYANIQVVPDCRAIVVDSGGVTDWLWCTAGELHPCGGD